jgi:hypothetical protein
LADVFRSKLSTAVTDNDDSDDDDGADRKSADKSERLTKKEATQELFLQVSG